MAGLQPHASRCDGDYPEGVSPKGAPQSISQKFPRAEEAPTETRRYHHGITRLDRQTTQESKSQCSDTLTGQDGKAKHRRLHLTVHAVMQDDPCRLATAVDIALVPGGIQHLHGNQGDLLAAPAV